jgi:omega-amidase
MVSQELTVSLIQTSLYWHDSQNNLASIAAKIAAIKEKTDLIVLPEMFTSGFTMNPGEVAESMEGTAVAWMQEMASVKNAAICGSMVIKEGNYFFNRFLFVNPNGVIEYYDKKHTFTLAGEDKVYKAGSKKTTISYKGWKISPLICYDLRFPVWSRNTNDYDVLIYVANWPEPRISAWDALLKARAIENMAYCIGVNRIGEDKNGHKYVGHSSVYDSLGNELLFMTEEKTATLTFLKSDIQTNRSKLRFLEDRDAFNLI